MMKHLFLIFLFAGSNIFAQNQEDLTFYCDVMANAFDGRHRVKAGKEFYRLFEESLKKDGSFQNAYSDLKWISIKEDNDKTFRIITWQIKDEKNKYASYGFVQNQNGQLIVLKDAVPQINKEAEYEGMDANNWYGALYYNLKEVSNNKGKFYILFGYDGLDDKNRVKVVDVLSFQNGKPVFGHEIFKIKDGARPDLKSRIIVDYSALANVNCNYDEELQMIVHDYAIVRMGVAEDGGPAKIPDGTYVGYKWDGQYWNLIEQLAHQVSKPEDIFYKPKEKESVKRDVFGRKKD